MTDDFRAVRRVTADSLVGRAVIATVRISAAAWQSSGVGALIVMLQRHVTDLPRAKRTRMIALAVAIGATINALLRPFLPLYSAPGIPITLVAAIAIVAAAVAANPEAFVAAWREWRTRYSKQR